MAEELNIIEPKNKFYEVTVNVYVESENKKGKIITKNQRETHLVDAQDPTDVQKKVIQAMAGTVYDWEIARISVAKVICVY